MIKKGDKVKCVKYLHYDVKMDRVYDVLGVQLSFDNKIFIHINNSFPKFSYDATYFEKVK